MLRTWVYVIPMFVLLVQVVFLIGKLTFLSWSWWLIMLPLAVLVVIVFGLMVLASSYMSQ